MERVILENYLTLSRVLESKLHFEAILRDVAKRRNASTWGCAKWICAPCGALRPYVPSNA